MFEKIKKNIVVKPLSAENKKTLFCILMVTVSTIIYCLGVMWFLEPASLLSGGVTGSAQLVSTFFKKVFKLDVNLGLLILLFNIPILLYGWKNVSKRFVICSVISIGLQTILMSGIIPFVDFGINSGRNPITGVTIPGIGTEIDLFLLACIGGFVSGVGSSLALRCGTSTGGFDILAQAVSFKKNISIGYLSLFINVVIAILGAILFGSPAVAFYTIIRIIVQSVVTDKIHTSYNYLRVEIITTCPEEISQQLFADIGRGITVMKAEGAYTHSEKSILETIVSRYEVSKVIEDAKRIDAHAFISVSPVKFVVGNFKKKTIA
jgi:uncharacterized membrane-anchored protein YitT (DUF2179 family)